VRGRAVAKGWGTAAALVALIASLWGFAAGGCAGSRALGDGSAGSRLFYSRCRSCHAPVDPASRSPEFWDEYLDLYAARAHLTSAERDSVMAFLVRSRNNARGEP
jgi:hypothetical protein